MIVDTHYKDNAIMLHKLGDKTNFFIHRLIYKPKKFLISIEQHFTSIKKLQLENTRIRQENLHYQGELNKLAALEIENEQLRQLLNAAPRNKDDFIVANITNINSDPYKRQIIVDKGGMSNIGEGQVVVDAGGIIGSVIQSDDSHSKVLLLTDTSHAIPVESLRSGVRSILIGTSNDSSVLLQHVPSTSDVRSGDIFVTSGIGGKYPFGYPVAVVSSVETEASNPFMKVQLKPLAHLGTNRQVLILHNKGDVSHE